MAKEERAKWFKMFLHQKALIDSVSDETAGKALKAAFRYFDSREMDDLDPLAFAVFSVIKPYIDESFNDYKKAVENGRAGGMKRWNNKAAKDDSPPIAPLSPPIGVSTEAEAEAEAEADADADAKGCCGLGGNPVRSGFTPPTIEEIRKHCNDNNYTFDPERFESYYRGKGWMLGSSPMQDWTASAKIWQQREIEKQSPSRPKHPPIPGVPTL